MTQSIKSAHKNSKRARLSLVLSALLASVSLSGTGAAWAEVPQVAVSIKPVHSLVSAVMEGVGTPQLIVKGTGSEHSYALRPEDARILASADIVFWVGPGMETFLQRPLDNLAQNAQKIELSEAPGIEHVEMREGGTFEAHTHDHGHGHDHEKEEKAKAEHDHDHGHDHAHEHEKEKKAEAKHDHDHDHAHEHSHEHEHNHEHSHEHKHAHDHDDDHAHEAAHDHEEEDLHFWLDPINAKAALAEIARVLVQKDPENAESYNKNVAAYEKRLDDLVVRINAEVEPVRGKPFIVFHDAYHYFEKRFDIPATGSITVSTAQAPGAQRVAEIRDKVRSLKAACVFSEPQFEPRLVSTVIEGTDAKTGVLDPLGFDIDEGPDQYIKLIENLASSLKQCLES